jgi:hypothetical protein
MRWVQAVGKFKVHLIICERLLPIGTSPLTEYAIRSMWAHIDGKAQSGQGSAAPSWYICTRLQATRLAFFKSPSPDPQKNK